MSSFARPVLWVALSAMVACATAGEVRGITWVWQQNARGQMLDCNGGDPGGEYQFPDNTLWSQDELRGMSPCGVPNTVLEPSNWNGPSYPNNTGQQKYDVVLDAPANTILDVAVTIDTLTVASDGHLEMLGGTWLHVEQSLLTNDSTIVVNSNGGGNTILSIFSSTHTGLLSGSGQVVLNEGWNGVTYGATFHAGGSQMAQDAGHTIRGKGIITAYITNNGIIEADDTSGGGDALLVMNLTEQVNNNIIRANVGATLRLEELKLTQDPGTGRLIGMGMSDPDPNLTNRGNVELGNDSHVVGGRLEGDIDIVGGNVILENVVNESTLLDSIPGTTTHLRGTFTNNGKFSLTSPVFNQFTHLVFDNSMSLAGGGELALGRFNAVRVSGPTGVTVTNDAGHTISGQGKWFVPLVNDGAVEAFSLSFENTTIENNSTMTALTNGGFTLLNTTVTQDPTSGRLLADMGGGINITSSTVIGGVLDWNPSLTMFTGYSVHNARLVNVHNKSRINVGFGSMLTVEGAVFRNDGPITVNNDSLGLGTRLRFEDSVSLEGSGEVRLNQTGNAALLEVVGGGVLTHAATHRIWGGGRLEAVKLVNHGEVDGVGVIDADVENDGEMINLGEINGDVVSTGTLGGSIGRTMKMNGDLTGEGPLRFIEINGRHDPSPGVGTIDVQGVYRVGAMGVLAIDLGGTNPGTEYDQIVLTDATATIPAAITLDGTLEVRLVDLGSGSFIPTLGDTFTILQTPLHMMDTVVGTFATLDLPKVAGGKGLSWDVIYNDHDVVLELASVLVGDYNGDGVVDAGDYVVWRNSLGSTTDLDADGDQSGEIDAGDYTLWKSQYGQMAPGALAMSAVPEPGWGWPLLLAFAAVLARRRRGFAMRTL